MNLGSALGGLGNSKESIFHLQTAIKLQPEYVQAHYNLGNALQIAGKNKDAISHYQTAIKLEPKLAEPTQKNLDRAISKLEK